MGTQKWYYAKRGNIRERGIIDDDELARMASSGELHPDDLLCGESSTAGWVRASSIEGLIKNTGTAPAEPATPVTSQPAVKNLSALAIVAVLAVVAALCVWRFLPRGAGTGGEPVSQGSNSVSTAVSPEGQSVTDRWAVVVARIRAQADAGNVEDAEALLARMRLITGDNDTVKDLGEKLSDARKRRAFEGLKATFKACLLDERGIRELADMAVSMGDKDLVPTLLATMLADQAGLNVARCRYGIKAATVIDDAGLKAFAVKEYLSRVDCSDSEVLCIEIVKLAVENGMGAEVPGKLQAFLSKHPGNAAIQFELAACLAQEGRSDEAIGALKKAVKAGGDSVKARAKADPRFDPIRGAWSFKWTVR